jgi:hypothetical protein
MEQADRLPPASPDYRGLALLVLAAAVGLALVLVATGLFIQMVV